jgi:hypothetical protein
MEEIVVDKLKEEGRRNDRLDAFISWLSKMKNPTRK